MRQHVTTVIVSCAAVLLAAAGADAQWNRSDHPSRGACFYENANFGGRYFCSAVGRHSSMVPLDANDKISSIRIYGATEVIVFKDANFRGQSRRFTSSITNLGWVGWGDRLSSYRVEDIRSNEYGGGWGGAYGGGSSGHNDSWHGDGNWGGAYGGGSRDQWDDKHGRKVTYQEAEQIVRRAYQRVLGRDPDPAARSWVSEVMKNNWAQRDLELRLMDSAEYRNRNKR